MKLCSRGHEEVCYESKYCPACENIATLKDDIIDLMQERNSLMKKMEAYEKEREVIENLVTEIKEDDG